MDFLGIVLGSHALVHALSNGASAPPLPRFSPRRDDLLLVRWFRCEKRGKLHYINFHVLELSKMETPFDRETGDKRVGSELFLYRVAHKRSLNHLGLAHVPRGTGFKGYISYITMMGRCLEPTAMDGWPNS